MRVHWHAPWCVPRWQRARAVGKLGKKCVPCAVSRSRSGRLFGAAREQNAVEISRSKAQRLTQRGQLATLKATVPPAVEHVRGKILEQRETNGGRSPIRAQGG